MKYIILHYKLENITKKKIDNSIIIKFGVYLGLLNIW